MLLSQSEVIHSALTGTQICCICTTHIFLCLFGWQSAVHPTETVERQEKWCGKRKEISSVSSTTHLFSFFFPHLKHTTEPLFFGACVILFISVGMVFKSLSFYCIHTHMKMCVSVCVWWYFCVLHHPLPQDGLMDTLNPWKDPSVRIRTSVCQSVLHVTAQGFYIRITPSRIFSCPPALPVRFHYFQYWLVKSKSIRYMKEPFSTTRWHILSLQSNVFSALI